MKFFKLKSQKALGKIQIQNSYCMSLEYYFEQEDLIIITGKCTYRHDIYNFIFAIAY